MPPQPARPIARRPPAEPRRRRRRPPAPAREPASPRRGSRGPLYVALFVVAVISAGALFFSGYTLGTQRSLTPGTAADQEQLFAPFWEAYNKIAASYVGPFSPKALVEGFHQGHVPGPQRPLLLVHDVRGVHGQPVRGQRPVRGHRRRDGRRGRQRQDLRPARPGLQPDGRPRDPELAGRESGTPGGGRGDGHRRGQPGRARAERRRGQDPRRAQHAGDALAAARRRAAGHDHHPRHRGDRGGHHDVARRRQRGGPEDRRVQLQRRGRLQAAAPAERGRRA